jgi:hypothetical protein
MRLLILTDNGEQDADWALALREEDHTPLRIAGQFDSPLQWFARVKADAARADAVLVGCSAPQLPETLAWVCGYAEGLGVQVILVTPHSGGIVSANPRNVRYATFEEALLMYFGTTRAMRGKAAVR